VNASHMRSYEIVLTADRSFMSDYRGLPFLRGLRFASTSILHESLFFRLVGPPVPVVGDGIALLAPYHTRRTEAALLAHGFDRSQVAVVAPDKIHTFVSPDTKVVSITVRDPLSRIHHYSLLNPLGRESYSSLAFKNLTRRLALRRKGFKVVVEGPGAWQLEDHRDRCRFPIDHVIVGEYSTRVVPYIFERIMDDEDVPDVFHAPSTELHDIPLVRGGVTEGLTEVARGCNRGCHFCNVGRVESRPLDEILAEVETNVRYGQNNVKLRSDDIFNYGAKGIEVNHEAVLKLYHSVKGVPGVKRVGQCYASLASVASEPALVGEVTEIIGAGSKEYPYTTVLAGIESGSPRLIEAHMLGKAWPFKPSQWPEVVEQGFGILNDNDWVPTGMLILGLPGESEEDVYETIALVESLRSYESVLVPFLFKAKSRLGEEASFSVRSLERHHLELIKAVFDHNAHWGKHLIRRHECRRSLTNWLLELASPFIGWGIEWAYERLFDEIVASASIRVKHSDSRVVLASPGGEA